MVAGFQAHMLSIIRQVISKAMLYIRGFVVYIVKVGKTGLQLPP